MHGHLNVKYLLHTEEFPAVLLHAEHENVKLLFHTVVCSLMIGQWGPKHVSILIKLLVWIVIREVIDAGGLDRKKWRALVNTAMNLRAP